MAGTNDETLLKATGDLFVDLTSRADYAHKLDWFGIPIFQVPTDMYIYQKLLWELRPELVIETGVARGGSLACIASLMHLVQTTCPPSQSTGNTVPPNWNLLGIDVNDVSAARENLHSFDFSSHVQLIQSDSTSEELHAELRDFARDRERVLIFLDSDHSEEHVFAELLLYSQLLNLGDHLVVWDSGLGRLSDETHARRPRAWNSSSHAGIAVQRFLETPAGRNFELRLDIAEPLLISSVWNGILKRVH